MQPRGQAFTYTATPIKVATERGGRVAILPRGLSDVDSLLDALDDRLSLPGYFGFNWNALSDCLRDFHWISERRIVLVHEDLPDLGRDDLAIYLDVLEEAVNDWGPDEDHQFEVVFPLDARSAILAAKT